MDLRVGGTHRCSRCILAVVGIVTVYTSTLWSNHLPYMDIALSEDNKKDLQLPPPIDANFTAAGKNQTITSAPSSQPTRESSSFKHAVEKKSESDSTSTFSGLGKIMLY